MAIANGLMGIAGRVVQLLSDEEGGLKVIYEPRLASTSAHLLELVDLGALSVPAVCYTDEQYAGQGTRGRGWEMQPGRDIAFTLAAPLARGLCSEPRVSLVAGAVLARALEQSADLEIGLRWPNDLLASQPPRKCGGILTQQRRGWLYLGVGVNVNSRAGDFPVELHRELVTLGDVRGTGFDRLELAAMLGAALVQHLLWGGSAEAETWLAEWQRRDRTAGLHYLVDWQGTTVAAVAQGVNPASGALVLETVAGERIEVASYTMLKRLG